MSIETAIGPEKQWRAAPLADLGTRCRHVVNLGDAAETLQAAIAQILCKTASAQQGYSEAMRRETWPEKVNLIGERLGGQAIGQVADCSKSIAGDP